MDLCTVYTSVIIKQDDENINWKISDGRSQDPKKSPLASYIAEDYEDYQQEVLLWGLLYFLKTW